MALTENRDMLGAMIAVLDTARWRLGHVRYDMGSYQNRECGRLESWCLECEGWTRDVPDGFSNGDLDIEYRIWKYLKNDFL